MKTTDLEKSFKKALAAVKQKSTFGTSADRKIYLGLKGGKREIFYSAKEPTQSSHGRLYNATVGPFRTMRGAVFMRDHGANNPHVQTVADAERISKRIMRGFPANGAHGYTYKGNSVVLERTTDRPHRWMVLVNGYQVGGQIDKSGAGDATFRTKNEALEFAKLEGYLPIETGKSYRSFESEKG